MGKIKAFTTVLFSSAALVACILIISNLSATSVWGMAPSATSFLKNDWSSTTDISSTRTSLPDTTATNRSDVGIFSNGSVIPIATPLSCSAPIIIQGSIITGTSPVMLGRLIRDGVPSLCGQSYTCSGVQSLSTRFSYQKFDILNTSDQPQCVRVDLDTTSCGQQVYSAAYLSSFDPTDQCSNIQGAMGYSTSGIYGYSFIAPANTNVTIVNNTIGIIPPSSDCPNYTMEVTLCNATPNIAVTKGVGLPTFRANSLGEAVVPIPVVFHNSGEFTGTVSAYSAAESIAVSVADGKPAVVSAEMGKAGMILSPGETLSETVMLDFSGSQFTCLSRSYQVNSILTMEQNVYYCNGYNPPSAEVVTGTVLPSDSFDEDGFAFQSMAGAHITVTVDTVSSNTAFDIEACLSDTPQGACLPGLSGDDNFACTFPPPSFGCPRFGGLLPDDSDGDGFYYLRINSGSGSSNFAGPTGDYRGTILITSGPIGACPLIPVLDNGSNSFLSFPFDQFIDTARSVITATVSPIRILVPPSNPANPGCDISYLPILGK